MDPKTFIPGLNLIKENTIKKKQTKEKEIATFKASH